MHIPAAIRTTFAPGAIAIRPMIRISLTGSELHALALAIEREADAAEREGRFTAAQRLRWRAADLREAGR